MKSAALLPLLLAAAALRAGAQQPAPAPAPAPAVAPLPSVELPPELDRVLRDYEVAWRAGNASALSLLFAEDGFVLQGGRPPVRGRDAIREAYARGNGGPLRLRALAWATADSIGYIVGAYGYDGDEGEMGKYVLTLRRGRDGRWLIFSDMDNASRPPRRMGPPPTGATPPPAP